MLSFSILEQLQASVLRIRLIPWLGGLYFHSAIFQTSAIFNEAPVTYFRKISRSC